MKMFCIEIKKTQNRMWHWEQCEQNGNKFLFLMITAQNKMPVLRTVTERRVIKKHYRLSEFQSRPAFAASLQRYSGSRWSERRQFLCTAGRSLPHQSPLWNIKQDKYNSYFMKQNRQNLTDAMIYSSGSQKGVCDLFIFFL